MGRRSYRCNAYCHHPGCDVTTFWICDSNEEYLRIERNNARNWMCLRHQHPETVLSVERPLIVHEVASVRQSHGVYWGNSGFVHGDGYKAWCGDFPEGTILRVTAEIILPQTVKPVDNSDQD